jgi:hypothetical protein
MANGKQHAKAADGLIVAGAIAGFTLLPWQLAVLATAGSGHRQVRQSRRARSGGCAQPRGAPDRSPTRVPVRLAVDILLVAVGLVDSPSALGVALAGGSNDHRLVVPIRAVAGTGGANAARLPVRGGSCCLLDAARMVSTRLCTFSLGWLESEMVKMIDLCRQSERSKSTNIMR